MIIKVGLVNYEVQYTSSWLRVCVCLYDRVTVWPCDRVFILLLVRTGKELDVCFDPTMGRMPSSKWLTQVPCTSRQESTRWLCKPNLRTHRWRRTWCSIHLRRRTPVHLWLSTTYVIIMRHQYESSIWMNVCYFILPVTKDNMSHCNAASIIMHVSYKVDRRGSLLSTLRGTLMVALNIFSR